MLYSLKNILTLSIALVLCYSCTTSSSNNTTNNSAPIVRSGAVDETPINDKEVLADFLNKAKEQYKENGGVEMFKYQESLVNKSCVVNTVQASSIQITGNAFYSFKKQSVLMIGGLFKCDHCPDLHISPASAWVLSEDGVCVTNYHVFKSYDPAAEENKITMFVMDFDRNVYPVTEVLAASKLNDLAIFRIDTRGDKMIPLPLGKTQGVGEPVNLISHPDGRFFTYTQGFIDRIYIKPGTSKVRQCMSAEFAKGSSGAPIMDIFGNAVGTVAGTQNIYTGPTGGVYQATIKEIIPVSKVWELIEKE